MKRHANSQLRPSARAHHARGGATSRRHPPPGLLVRSPRYVSRERGSGVIGRPGVEPSVEGSEPRLSGGVAALGALVAFVLVGVVDGLIAYARMPSASRSLALLGWCVVHCVGVLSALGLGVAAAQELFVRAASNRPPVRGLGRWLLAGPSRWWRRDEPAALALASSLTGALPAGVALVAVASYVTRTFQSRALMVAPIALALPAAVALGSAASVVASWPLAPLVRRAGRLASVGAVATVASGLALVPVGLAASRYRDALSALDPVALGLAAALIAADVALVALLLRLSPRPPRRSPVASVAIFFTLACVALAAVPALGLGRRQAVLTAVASRSAIAKRALGPLQRSLDRDRDGHGVLFGGADCDDHNPRAYPGAREIPGNGVDESCSGHDAPAVASVGSHGRFVTVTGPLADRPPSVLFISIDAARPDRMSAFGYHRPTTPNIARFAERAARFTNAYSVAPGSLRSFASTFTGRYPGDVAWTQGSDPHFPSIAEENETLAEALRAAGYATAAFTNTSYFSGTPGFYQGFEVVQDEALFKDDAAPIVQGAAEWIERPRDQPFFAWVHLIDAHAPYGEHTWPQNFGRSESDRYDAELARADAFAARVLDAADRLERRGARVLVVVFSDHGEGFDEHGSRYHFYDVHEESIRVPLLVRAPGIAPGERHALTALFDLYATVLNLAGRPMYAESPSRSLVPVLLSRHGGAPPDWREEVYADVAEYGGGAPTSRALIAPPWKIAFDASRSVWEMYNLALDPGEQRNLYDEDPARARELRARLLDGGAGRR
ncbi:MAG: sulfatase-like hydrolase/transferase [Deltaproteobacteria bacterium]|nr:sulfatase-like hydrolase/transferase [Deltaproteobacteria bacterium]